jgi:N-acetylglucosaminylphosphatidylinositol deacetylase
MWPLSVVSDIVCDCLDNVGPDLVRYYIWSFAVIDRTCQVVTFDDRGVSGHPNHIATGKGTIHAVTAYSKTADIVIYCVKLDTTNCLRKFSGPLDIILSLCLSDMVVVSRNPMCAYRAMKAHRSQMVWFRYLFIIFSRYTYVNTFSVVAV